MPKTDIDIIIEVLEEARLLSVGVAPKVDGPSDPHKERIVMDLVEEQMLRGENLTGYEDRLIPFLAAVRGINLKGRRYLQELKDYKRDRGFFAGAGKAFWLVAGSILSLSATLLAAYLKVRWSLP